jgi:hypothetical protein
MMKCIESVRRVFKQLILAPTLALHLQPPLQPQPSLTPQAQAKGLAQKASLPTE